MLVLLPTMLVIWILRFSGSRLRLRDLRFDIRNTMKLVRWSSRNVGLGSMWLCMLLDEVGELLSKFA